MAVRKLSEKRTKKRCLHEQEEWLNKEFYKSAKDRVEKSIPQLNYIKKLLNSENYEQVDHCVGSLYAIGENILAAARDLEKISF